MIYTYLAIALLTAGYTGNSAFTKESRDTLRSHLAGTGVGEEIIWLGITALVIMFGLAWPAYWTLCAIGWVVRRRLRGPK